MLCPGRQSQAVYEAAAFALMAAIPDLEKASQTLPYVHVSLIAGPM
jgi:hypothetical protein